MLLRQDELNNLKADIAKAKGNPAQIKEFLLDFLILAYADGRSDASVQLGGSADFDVERMNDVLYAEIDGENFEDRADEWIYLEDYDAIIRLAENERERVYNTSAYDAATQLGAQTKTWHTMLDNRVRDTHDYLEGMTKPIGEEFHTYNGDSAQHPGGFGVASEDINCRCYLTFSK